ncbi:MAG TPA: TetR/AcrR family transcriptional regulator [Opitutus sp.]|nr:TetR/AcrR family transcriptional regulator [Opitutus sp.]
MMTTAGIVSQKDRRAHRERAAAELRGLIVEQGRSLFFSKGYSAFTMDDLAGALGLSKKTLYVFFRSKESLIRSALDDFASGVRAEADRLLADSTLGFAEKIRAFALVLMKRLSRMTPEVLQDVQLSAPALHRHIEQLRTKHIPYIFGRFIEEGQAAGLVRKDITPVFAGEFYLHAIQGMLQPATLQRLRMRPELVMDRALQIYFSGLLNTAGHQAYEKSLPQ